MMMAVHPAALTGESDTAAARCMAHVAGAVQRKDIARA
jgi:hypothetical protein